VCGRAPAFLILKITWCSDDPGQPQSNRKEQSFAVCCSAYLKRRGNNRSLTPNGRAHKSHDQRFPMERGTDICAGCVGHHFVFAFNNGLHLHLSLLRPMARSAHDAAPHASVPLLCRSRHCLWYPFLSFFLIFFHSSSFSPSLSLCTSYLTPATRQHVWGVL
jgi:hypothetical protein